MSKHLRHVLGLVGGFCLTTLPAWAELAEHVAAPVADTRMPQFRPEHFPGQLFWLALAFWLLYRLLKQKALPNIAAVQANRQQQKAADLSAAAAANDRAKEILADYEKSVAIARQQAQQKLAGIVQAAQQQAAQQQAAQQTELNAKLATTERNIATMRSQALAQVQDEAKSVTVAMVKQLRGVEAAPATVAAAVAAARGRN